MTALTVLVGDLKPRDLIPLLGLSVTGVDAFSSLVIIELSDGTATAPIPSNTVVEIQRPEA